MSAEQFPVNTLDTLRPRRWVLWIIGMFSVVLGILAIVFPFAATIGVELAIGALLGAAGIAELVRAFSLRGAVRTLGHVLFALLALIVGVMLLFFPLTGAITLTMLLAVFFIVGGIFKIIGAYSGPAHLGRGWLVVSGALSILIGFVIAAALPASSLWVIGLLFGIDLIFFGLAQMAFAAALKNGSLG